MYSGQGTQLFHMGRELFEKNPVFKKWMNTLDSLACDMGGESILRYLYDDRKRKVDLFESTRLSHPAIFMVEYSLTQVLLQTGIEPEYVLGTSMGEFVSATLAGIMSLEETFEAVIRQAEILERHCEKGGMISILHDPALYAEDPLLSRYCELAGVNFEKHFVVAGGKNNLILAEEHLRKKKIVHQVLPVSVGFHSTSIDPAEQLYIDYLARKSFAAPSLPVISCSNLGILTGANPSYFWEIIRKPILFQKVVTALDEIDDFLYIDLGPTDTLSNFIKHNLSSSSGSETLSVLSPFRNDSDGLQKLKDYFHKG